MAKKRNAAPVETAPVETAPVETAPVETAPEEWEVIHAGTTGINAVESVKNEMDSINEVRKNASERIAAVKACATKLYLWYAANTPAKLDLTESLKVARKRTCHKCDINAIDGKQSDGYGPVRAVFDDLRARLLHDNLDLRDWYTEDLAYESFDAESVLSAVTTGKAIRDAKKAEKSAIAEKAAKEQFDAAVQEAVKGHDVTAEYLAMQSTIRELQDRVASMTMEHDAALTAARLEIERLESANNNAIRVNARLAFANDAWARRYSNNVQSLADCAAPADVEIDWNHVDNVAIANGYKVMN